MTKRDIIEIYKKEIELYLGTMCIYKGNDIVNNNAVINEKNKAFILEQMTRIKAGNFDKELMDIAIDELLPYLREI